MTNIRLMNRWPCFGLLAGFLLGGAAIETGCKSAPQPEKATGVPPAIEELLTEMRAANARAKATYTIAFNPAMLKPVESLAGTVAPKDLLERAARHRPIGEEMLRLDLQGRDEFVRASNLSATDKLWAVPELRRVACNAGLRAWDWRRDGAVSPVKNQQCGNCWSYASAGALESSYLIRNHELIDVSEQYIVNCAVADNGSDAGTCGGGWHEGVFEYMISHGVGSEASLSDAGADQACDANIAAPYRAVAWGYVDTPAAASGFGDSISTVESLKEALCAHGPLAVAVLATSNFQAYSGDSSVVFNESVPDSTLTYVWDGNKLKYHAINHDVLLIGWDDSKHAWLIKNSWGTGWGINAGVGAITDKGYMWIDYNSNNIGLGAAWVQAKHWAYRLPDRYTERFRPRLPFPDPGPLRIEDLTRRLIRQ